MNRNIRAEIANQTLEILEARSYVSPKGMHVELQPALSKCIDGTRLIEPEELARLLVAVNSKEQRSTVQLEVANETTLEGIANLLRRGDGPVAALNFASAKNPGGGFLSGSQAQEESLARSSGLYSSLMKAWPFYEAHRASSSTFYSDRMIYSPLCPIIRNDDGKLLEEIQLASFITSAAPNAGAIAQNQPDEVGRIGDVLRQRAEYVLTVAATFGYKYLVLGAWGCGVFKNDPAMVSNVFGTLLRSPRWASMFEVVRFSVYDSTPNKDVFKSFEGEFG